MGRLPRSFFARDTRLVARELLGRVLVRVLDDGTRLSGRIVETEAYCPGDTAAHAYRGQTARNAPMFMQPGVAYVYFTYGMHYCFNVVTEQAGTPAAVLVRALEPLEGIDIMRQHRSRNGVAPADRDLCRGPARLCRALCIDRAFNGYDMLHVDSRLFIERGHPVPDSRTAASPRIGVSGDPIARTVEWRWFVADSPFVSR
ncbi:MAG: DNA-3-methyladenine glycosylase [Anaerolineae bacterium]|nr:DNA-3-methyladenine glycosylase [Thermoflexales bacterium]MDW8407442.1 DNA-3-methyladenine glycosylase [Anaerolineae bacterium]